MVYDIYTDPTVQKELDAVQTKEDAMLWCWKLHNAVSARLFPTRVPFPDSVGLKSSLFTIPTPESQHQFQLTGVNSVLRKEIIDALTTRWVASDGLEVHQWSKRDLLNLPPDRTMYGRAFWTYMHTTSVYLPHTPNPEQLAAFKGIFDAIYEVFACPVCRGHFHLFYHDPVLQAEHEAIRSKHDAILFVWKLHNVVTTDGILRGQWPDRKPFPPHKKLDGLGHLNTSEFAIPSPTSAQDQMRLQSTCATSTPTCLDKQDRFEIIADVQSRWQIEGGIDQPLRDDAPLAACGPPAAGQKKLRMDMYIMGKCPWCAKAMDKIADTIKCDYTCERNGVSLSARLDFQVHMVGLNNGSYANPWLRAIHGPSELVGERLELCARQHYPKNYQYVKFLHCMDLNVSIVPLRAPECAESAGMDLDLLVACANMEGERLVAGSYGFSSWMGIEITPTFVLNHKKKVMGLPDNFTDIVCEHIAEDPDAATSLAQATGGVGRAEADALLMEGPLGARAWLVGAAAIGFVCAVVGGAWLVRRSRRQTAETRSLLRP